LYTACFDGSVKLCQKNGHRASIAYVIYDSNKQIIYEHSQRIKKYNSMQAEYIALVELLKKIIELDLKNVMIYSDCMNLVSHLKSRSIVVKESIIKYYLLAKELLVKINDCNLFWIKRKYNKYADYLTKKEIQ
jgi:ribonuclease HI